MGIIKGNITALSLLGLLGITIYSIIYGVLEYFLFHSSNYGGFLKISKYFPNMYFYWSFMLLSAIGFTAIFCRHWVITLWSMWLFPVLEDLFFFISLGLHKQEYSFPVSNWYDDAFWITKILKCRSANIVFSLFPQFLLGVTTHLLIWNRDANYLSKDEIRILDRICNFPLINSRFLLPDFAYN